MNNHSLSFPAELLLIICDKLYLSNLKDLRLACKFLAELLSFLVLSNIRIQATSIEDLVCQLRFLTNPPSVAVNCTTGISIHGFRDNGDRVAYEDRQKLRGDLFTALVSLKAVRMVRWSPRVKDPSWFQESIWSAIRCLPALRTLYIEATFLNINLDNLNTLIALESIYISGGFKHELALFENDSKLYASSTSLISIELDVFPDKFDLRRLLACRPKVDVASRLRHLAISRISVRIDENTLPHLNNLTSLKLADVKAGSPDKIWNAFRLSRIHLQELDIGYSAMGHAVNDYLSSFSGLKKLRLHIDPFDNQESLDASAVKFWSNSFLNHVDTLQDFGVRTDYDSQWCFGDHNRSVIAKCTKLKRLTISVCPSDIPRQESDPEGITPLIGTVLTHMPDMGHLGLDVSLSNYYLGDIYESAWMSKSHLRGLLKHWILKYEPASSFGDRFAEVDVFLNHKMIIGRKQGS